MIKKLCPYFNIKLWWEIGENYMDEKFLNVITKKMDNSIGHYQRGLGSVRTGRANPSMIEDLQVDYFGTSMPLNQLAQISVGDARMLIVQPWDRNGIESIGKAIQKSDLGINPNIDGEVIRLNIPAMTEERRREVVKIVKGKAEEARVSIRNLRKDARDEIRDSEKAGLIGEDQSKRGQNDLQKMTDEFINKINEMTSSKESEVMQV